MLRSVVERGARRAAGVARLSTAPPPADLAVAFSRACDVQGPAIAQSSDNGLRLRAYGLFKQATGGDAPDVAPSMFDLAGRAKHGAWATLRGTTKEQAMRQYVELAQTMTAGAPSSQPRAPGRVDVSKAASPTGAGSGFLPAMRQPMLPADTFKGQLALVTGGGTGLGKAMATALSRLGATVCITSRKLDVLTKTAQDIAAASGNEVIPLPCDVRDPEAVARLFDALAERTGGRTPTLIVNNAAGNFVAPFERLTPGGWKAITEIVLNGTAFVTMEGGKRLIASGQGGVFLSVTTTYADTGSGYVVPSAAAKAGVSALLKSLAAEWGQYGMRFVGIAPGPIETKGAFSRLDPGGQFKALLTQRLPAKRLGAPEELANLATFLLSPYASWLTGTVVTLDGGETAALGGEFNALSVVTPAQWDAMEAAIRGTKGS